MERGLQVIGVSESTTADKINRSVSENDVEYVAFADETAISATLSQAISDQFDPSQPVIVLFPNDIPLLSIVPKTVPAEFLPFALSPLDFGIVVVSTGVWTQVGETSDVAEPIRDWLMRAVNDRVSIQLASANFDRSRDFDVATRLPELGPECSPRQSNWLYTTLSELNLQKMLSSIGSEDDVTALKSGLLLLNSYLDASHNQSQSIEGCGRNVAGDYWHAIMHRREPDYPNSKYWFRRVGQHPIFSEVATIAGQILDSCTNEAAMEWKSRLGVSNGWDPFAFVDLCQSATQSQDAELQMAAKQIQFAEKLLLLGSTYHDACG